MSARKPDPVIAAWDRLRAAEKAWDRAYDRRDEADSKARAAGFSVSWPVIRINGTDCLGMDSARRHARDLPQAEATKAIEAMRAALDIRQQARRKAGLAPFDAAERRAASEWRAAMRAMATTRATTPAGVILKLKLIELELRDGKSSFGEGIIASAIGDLGRMARSRRNRVPA
ncbi:MAG TPA: hypothetical protein VGF92_07370 [Stellaceae bacterium]|jgi:hypothetical protein